MTPRGLHALLLAAIVLGSGTTVAVQVVEVKKSYNAPGGLSRNETPQFLVFTHDDDVASASSKLVLGLTDAFRNPNGCRLPATWYACTQGCNFVCAEAKRLYAKGHEIGVHTLTHPDLRGLSKSGIKKEIVGARDAIAKCGIPKSKLQGFRTPFLSDKPDVRAVLFENSFRYDSTIGAEGGKRRPWPATMEDGVPYNCNQGGNQCSGSERYPGMWEVPLYQAGGNLMDYCTNEATGEPESGCDVYQVLKKQFDDAYGGNRGPVQILVHTPYLKKQQYHAGIKKFLKYATAKRDVWGVTMQQLLDWMEDPVPAAEMQGFLARYKCVK